MSARVLFWAAVVVYEVAVVAYFTRAAIVADRRRSDCRRVKR